MSDNLSSEQRREMRNRALAEVTRVSREGGTSLVEMPDHEGRVVAQQIDQERARELKAWFNDTFIIEFWTEIRAGNTLSSSERKALKDWTDVTLAEAEDAERESRAISNSRRAHLTVIGGGKR